MNSTEKFRPLTRVPTPVLSKAKVFFASLCLVEATSKVYYPSIFHFLSHSIQAFIKGQLNNYIKILNGYLLLKNSVTLVFPNKQILFITFL